MTKKTVDSPIIGAVREFIAKCPYLPEYIKIINVDYQSDDIGTYSVEATPSNQWIKKYINGTGIKQFTFNLTSREIYTEDVRQNIENSGFYQKFAEWLDQCTNLRDLPVLGQGKEALNIHATTSGYVFDADNGNAVYVIQCNMQYFYEGGISR